MANDSFMNNPMWDRSGDYRQRSTMSRRLYMMLVCIWTAAGIAFSAAFATISQDWDVSGWNRMEYLGFLLGVLVFALIGATIASSSSSPGVSLIGYGLIAGPFGLMLGPFVAMYESSSIVRVFLLTSVVVLTLGLVGVLIPDDLSSWGVPLIGALMLLIAGYILVPLFGGLLGFPVERALTGLDWIALVVFGGLVIFDLNRASRLAYTADNAVDSAVAIYLDFVNIFIRLLALTGKKK